MLARRSAFCRGAERLGGSVEQSPGMGRRGKCGVSDERAIKATLEPGIYPTVAFANIPAQRVAEIQEETDCTRAGVEPAGCPARGRGSDRHRRLAARFEGLIACGPCQREAAKALDARVHAALKRSGGEGRSGRRSSPVDCGASAREQGADLSQGHGPFPDWQPGFAQGLAALALRGRRDSCGRERERAPCPGRGTEAARADSTEQRQRSAGKQHGKWGNLAVPVWLLGAVVVGLVGGAEPGAGVEVAQDSARRPVEIQCGLFRYFLRVEAGKLGTGRRPSLGEVPFPGISSGAEQGVVKARRASGYDVGVEEGNQIFRRFCPPCAQCRGFFIAVAAAELGFGPCLLVSWP